MFYKTLLFLKYQDKTKKHFQSAKIVEQAFLDKLFKQIHNSKS